MAAKQGNVTGQSSHQREFVEQNNTKMFGGNQAGNKKWKTGKGPGDCHINLNCGIQLHQSAMCHLAKLGPSQSRRWLAADEVGWRRTHLPLDHARPSHPCPWRNYLHVHQRWLHFEENPKRPADPSQPAPTCRPLQRALPRLKRNEQLPVHHFEYPHCWVPGCHCAAVQTAP